MQLPITLAATSALALIFVVLSLAVVRARMATKTSLGDGSDKGQGSPLLVAARRHANFAEYVPLSLLLIGLIEGMGGNRGLVMALAGALVLSRLLHPLGMGRPAPNAFRGGGIGLNWLVLLVGGAYGLWLALLR